MESTTHKHASNHSIAIIDDDESFCRALSDAMGTWKLSAQVFLSPEVFLNSIQQVKHDVILLDVCMPESNGLDLIPVILEHHPDMKIIVMTGFVDTEVVIRALKLGAYDFLEKPLDTNILRHAVGRAVEFSRAQKEQKALFCELKSHKEELEFVNGQLRETNRALSLFAQNLDREREEFEKRVATKLRTVIIRNLEKMLKDKSLTRYETEFEAMIDQIEGLASGFSAEAKYSSTLTYSEQRVASMIKAGMTTEEISERLNISVATVKTHRRNIRKKINITNSHFSLKNYLQLPNSFRK